MTRSLSLQIFLWWINSRLKCEWTHVLKELPTPHIVCVGSEGSPSRPPVISIIALLQPPAVGEHMRYRLLRGPCCLSSPCATLLFSSYTPWSNGKRLRRPRHDKASGQHSLARPSDCPNATHTPTRQGPGAHTENEPAYNPSFLSSVVNSPSAPPTACPEPRTE